MSALKEVAVDIHGDADFGVPHSFADGFGVRSKFDEQRRVAVAEVVWAERRQSGGASAPIDDLSKRVIGQRLSGDGREDPVDSLRIEH